MSDSEPQFNVLGPVEVRVGAGVVDVGPARGQGVLAVLLLEANRPVTTDQLVERVWGERRLPDRPRHTVQTYVSLLRRALCAVKDATILRRSDGYLLSVDERLVDVHRFRALVRQARTAGEDRRAMSLFERALAHWRGDALGVQDTPYLNGVRAGLSQERREAERDLTDLHLRGGMHGAVLAGLSYWAQEYPLDERLAGQLMLALVRCGRQADALGHYQRLRLRLAEELGADPVPALQTLYQQILVADPALTAPTPPPITTPPRTRPVTAPRQLPAAPRLLTGRAGELRAIDEAVEQNEGGGDPRSGIGAQSGNRARAGERAAADRAQRSRPGIGSGPGFGGGGGGDAAGGTAVVAISGPAGIGKTALALHWSHRNLARFPDAQLFVDLCGHERDAAPVTANDALGWFLRALGVGSAAIPAEQQERSALYRSLLADRRALIVLDNARDSRQVRPLLPGSASCLTITTSRHQLTGLVALEGALPVALDPLDPREARELLTRRLGERRCANQPRAVDELVTLCGGRPLDLSAAAARAAVQPEWPLADLVAELRARRERHPAADAPRFAPADQMPDSPRAGYGVSKPAIAMP